MQNRIIHCPKGREAEKFMAKGHRYRHLPPAEIISRVMVTQKNKTILKAIMQKVK